MMVRCRKRTGRLEHINETGFASVPLANEDHGGVALRGWEYQSLNTDCSRRYHTELSCTSPTDWLPERVLTSLMLHVAHCVSVGVLQNMFWQLPWRVQPLRRQHSGITPRCRTAVTGSTVVLPIRTGPVGIWCRHRADAHQRTSVLAGLSCSRLDVIHCDDIDLSK